MKKLLTAFLAGLMLLPFMVKDVSAAVPEIEAKKAALEANIETHQPNAESFSSVMSVNTMIDWGIYPIIGGKPEKIASANGETKITYSKGMLGEMGKMMAWMFNNPAATTERYVADVLDSAGVKIVQPAYAQGLGFASLDPILNTWKTFRNMAYLLFVVVFMVIGFLIMMRQKVGGQTVVTAQQAIPHIIIALLLVTFSYAIAGLLIDLMYLVMYLLLALFGKEEQQFLNKNFLTLGWTMVTNGAGAAYDAVQSFGEQMENSLAQFGQDVVKFLGSLTLMVVVAIAIALKVFELFFELLKTYVTIVLTIAFSPIILAMGAIPGKSSFEQWVKDLVGNLAAFPTVLLVLIVFDELTGGLGGGEVIIESGGFQPPYLFGAGTSGVLPFIIGMGMLMIMPEIVKEAKKALGAKEGIFSQFSRDMGKSLGKGWEGGELIPGMSFTDTRKAPWGGISGENLARKQMIGLSALGRGAGAMIPGLPRAIVGTARRVATGGRRAGSGQLGSRFVTGARKGGGWAADVTSDENLYQEQVEARKAAKEAKKKKK